MTRRRWRSFWRTGDGWRGEATPPGPPRPPPPWYVLLLLGTGLQRLLELSHSARLQRKVIGRRADPGAYPLMVAVHVALFTAPMVELALRGRRPSLRGATAWLAVEAVAVGLRWWCIVTLGPNWNAAGVVPQGFRPVTSGPYRWVRHPNYLAVALEFLALPLAGGATVSAGVLSGADALLLWRRIVAEERLLEASPEYAAAFRGKPRFLPGLL